MCRVSGGLLVLMSSLVPVILSQVASWLLLPWLAVQINCSDLPFGIQGRSWRLESCLQKTPYCPWNSRGQNPGVGSCSFLYRIFPTQGLNPGLPHCRWILYHLSHQGRPNKKQGTKKWLLCLGAPEGTPGFQYPNSRIFFHNKMKWANQPWKDMEET